MILKYNTTMKRNRKLEERNKLRFHCQAQYSATPSLISSPAFLWNFLVQWTTRPNCQHVGSLQKEKSPKRLYLKIDKRACSSSMLLLPPLPCSLLYCKTTSPSAVCSRPSLLHCFATLLGRAQTLS